MTGRKVVVVSGASGGIGSAICKRFVQEGALTVGVDRDLEGLRRLQEDIGCDDFVPLTADVADAPDIARLFEVIHCLTERVDVLVNNAGFFPVQPFHAMTLAQWRQVTAVNLDSVFLMTSSLLPLLKASGQARVINVSSASVFKGVPGQSHYVAAKAGVIGLSRCLAWELAADGINVNVVTPGLTTTEAARKALGPVLEKGRAQRALQCELYPEDIVGAITFLAGDGAARITGQIINVDGGALMH